MNFLLKTPALLQFGLSHVNNLQSRRSLARFSRVLINNCAPSFTSGQIQSKRAFSKGLFKGSQGDSKFRESDRVSDDYELIYKSSMDQMVYYGQIALNITTIAATGVILYKFSQTSLTLEFLMGHWDYIILSCGLYGTFAVLTVTQMRMPIRMYYDESSDRFKAIFYTFNPRSNSQLEFSADEVVVCKENPVVPWSDHTCLIQGRKAIFMPNSFKSGYYYNKIFKFS